MIFAWVSVSPKNDAFVACMNCSDDMCRRAVSGIPSDSNRVGHRAMFVARKSYCLFVQASFLTISHGGLAVHRLASYSVQRVFGAIVEFRGDGVGIRPNDGG